MAQKRIKNINSMMIFTGSNADINALALEDRRYDIFSDEYIGKLKMTNSFDSVFDKTPSEVFVETTPKYKSIKDITEIAYAYINNKSSIKQSDGTNMYIDKSGTINFLYDLEDSLDNILDNGKLIPASDVKLFLASMNNGMYNKQKYYSSNKEIESISNIGVKYFWRPQGTYFDVYNEDTQLSYNMVIDNDYISYELKKIQVQATSWDESTQSYIPIFDTKITYTTGSDGTETAVEEKVPRMITKNVLEYADSFDKVIKSKLDEFEDRFYNKYDEHPELLTYYLYDYNSTIPVVLNTYSVGQNTINVNINYDGEFNNWFHNRISFNVKDLTSSEICKITPGEKYWFNLAHNENNRFVGPDINSKNEITFSYNGDSTYFNNISILSPYKIKKLDLSSVAANLTGTLDLLCQYNKKINYNDSVSTNWIDEKGNMLEELIIGKEGINCKLSLIVGLDKLTNLKKIDLTGCDSLTANPDLSILPNVSEFDLSGSNVSVFKPANGSSINNAVLPDNVESIILNNISFKNLDSLKYNINDQLTTLELNNVSGIDTLKFIETWISELDKGDKIDKGLVNYVNITNVNWDYANVDMLLKLNKIELNNFTGNVNVCGNGVGYTILRKDYQALVNSFGQSHVFRGDGDSDLKLNVVLSSNAYNVKFEIIEEYQESHEEQNEYGEWIIVTETKERPYTALTINVNDTITGNSFIDAVVKNVKKQLTHVKRSQFVNNNGIEIGWTVHLNEALSLPVKSEKPEELKIGDVLLYNKNSIVFVQKNVKNINQNFTKIGQFESIEDLNNLLEHEFEMDYFYSLSSMEEEIEIPSVNEDNFIEVDYGERNFITVEYGEKK